MTDERSLMEFVAGEGLLGSYLQYARTLTAAPVSYHLATGLSIIAGAIGSNVTFVGGGGTEHWPNLYVCILGPTGFHKTTAIRIGCRLLKRAAPGTIAPNEFSREQFLTNLQRNPSAVLEIDEFSTLLSQMERSYQAGLKEMLTDLYDPHDEYTRTLRGEKGAGEVIRIIRPALTILAGSNVDWLVSHLTAVDFRSGFMPRFLLWPGSVREPEPPDGMLTKGDLLTENRLVKQLAAIAQQKRAEATFSKPAIKQIVRFSRERMAVAETEPMPEELLGLISRSGLHVGKLAVLLTVADEGAQPAYEVTDDQAKRACQLMDWLVEQAQLLFEQHIVFEKAEQKAQRLLRLMDADVSEWSVLLKRSKLLTNEFTTLMKTLEERGDVETFYEKRQGRGRSSSAKMVRRIWKHQRPNGEFPENSGELQGNPEGTPGEFHQQKVVEWPLRRIGSGREGGE